MSRIRTAFEGTATKLHKYVSDHEAGQPALNFLRAVRILGLARVCVISHELAKLSHIPRYSHVPRNEYDLYVWRH
jgi:hypothetical protein